MTLHGSVMFVPRVAPMEAWGRGNEKKQTASMGGPELEPRAFTCPGHTEMHLAWFPKAGTICFYAPRPPRGVLNMGVPELEPRVSPHRCCYYLDAADSPSPSSSSSPRPSDTLILRLTHTQIHSYSDSLILRLTRNKTNSHLDALMLIPTYTHTHSHSLSDSLIPRLTHTQTQSYSDSLPLNFPCTHTCDARG